MFLQLSRVSYSRCFRCEPRIRLSTIAITHSTTTFHSRNFPSFHLRDDSTNNLPPELSCDLHHRTPTLPLFFRSHARLRLHFSIVFRSERRFIEGNFYLLCYLLIRRTISKLNDIEGTIEGLRAARSREQ